ncbi:hypothetical protein AB0912_24815 [Streptomyces sp. NPDC007084]|uniref:hypothetical protein n=1 Tax=Streptomyces sp. NPDC007084 TaxID=3154313 RepID=UPI003453BDB9
MAEYEEADALLAAITDAPLPQGARDDIVFMAEHRSAREDVDVLREQLVIIGDALAADRAGATRPAGAAKRRARPAREAKASRKARAARSPAPGRPAEPRPLAAPGRPPADPGHPPAAPGRPLTAPGRTRRRGAFAVGAGALAAAAAASLVVGMGWLAAQGGTGANDATAGDAKADQGAKGSLSAPGYIACSRLIVEGTVAKVGQVPGTGQDRVTLDVYHYYKPAKGEKEITFLMDRDVGFRPRQGDEVLVGIPRHAATPDIWTTGDAAIARERSWIVKALPESRGLTCEE